jgi:adenylosuccinate synthase
MINGVTELSMMKADVLSIFQTIRICTHYKVNGNITDEFPFSISNNLIEPVYEDVPGWNCDLTSLTSYDSAPDALKNYVSYLEKLLEIPITIVSVGPDRNQTLITKH